MENLLQEAQQHTKEAFAVLRKTRAVSAWELRGATVRLVGSLASGLYYDSRDIDLHVYTDVMDMESAFAAMGAIASVPGVKKVTFDNLLDAPDACCEWHAVYQDEQGKDWTLDIIHIAPQSRYVGYFEKQAETIKNMLTDETRLAVLQIKKALAGGKEHVGGIWIYLAVLKDGVRTPEDFAAWYAKQDKNQIIEWPLAAQSGEF